MSDPRPPRSLSRLLCGTVLVMSAVFAVPAQAALDYPVTIRLIAPGGLSGDATPIAVSDSVDPATGIVAGDASGIGSVFMLPGESIQFADNSILLRVAGGADTGTALVTGYFGQGGEHARYEFDGLVAPGREIVGIDVFAFDGFGNAGFSGVTGGVGVSLAGPHSVLFNLDDLVFVDRGNGTGNAFGEFRIDLLTRAVPEPAAWVWILAGFVGVGGIVRSGRRARAQPC